MADALNPESGRWYKRRDDGNSFEVLFVDSDAGDIEIRYFGGATETLNLSSWHQLRLTRREPPHTLREPRIATMSESASDTALLREPWSGPLDWTGTDD